MSILCSMGLQNLEVLGSELAELCFRLYLEHFIELSVSAFLYLVDPISPVLKEYFVDMRYSIKGATQPVESRENTQSQKSVCKCSE